jgi:hypothetical protein
MAKKRDKFSDTDSEPGAETPEDALTAVAPDSEPGAYAPGQVIPADTNQVMPNERVQVKPSE